MINSPLQQQTWKKKLLEEEDLITIHHNMMVVYGWIPLEEFREIPLPTLLSLAKLVDEEVAKRERFRLYSLKFYGVKKPE